jgi:hypothetical protein
MVNEVQETKEMPAERGNEAELPDWKFVGFVFVCDNNGSTRGRRSGSETSGIDHGFLRPFNIEEVKKFANRNRKS